MAMRGFVNISILAVFLFAISGCNKGPTVADKEDSVDSTTPTFSGNIRQLKELKTTDIKVGEGAPVQAGDLVFMTYTGKLKNGVQFDSNDRPDASPYGLTLQNHEVIPGWDLGIVGMRVGGVRKIDVPNNLAYGDNPQGDLVPPGADLYFEVKLLDAVRKGEEASYDKKDLVVGSGKACKMGDLVEVNYIMKLVNGRVADKFLDKDKPVVFRIGPRLKDGDREVPKGIYTAMIGMKEGGKRFMRIPPAIGLQYSTNTKVPSNNILLIELTLLKVQ